MKVDAKCGKGVCFGGWVDEKCGDLADEWKCGNAIWSMNFGWMSETFMAKAINGWSLYGWMKMWQSDLIDEGWMNEWKIWKMQLMDEVWMDELKCTKVIW